MRYKIKEPDDVARLLQNEKRNATRKHFVMIGLNTKNEVTIIYIVHIGTLDMSLVHRRDSFQVAIMNNCESVIFAHNHPSQDVTSSVNDIVVAKKLKLICQLIGINVLGSLVSQNDFSSLEQLELLGLEISLKDLFE